MRKRILSLLLCIVLCLSFAPTAAFAASDTGSLSGNGNIGDRAWNLRLDENGILHWDNAVEGPHKIQLWDNGRAAGGNMNATGDSWDLQSYMRDAKKVTGTYSIQFNPESVERKSESVYFYYISPLAQLSAPANLSWNGQAGTWDAVPNATQYRIYLRHGDGILQDTYYTNNTSYDFGTNARDGYVFEVVATADNYLDSNAVTSPRKSGTASDTGSLSGNGNIGDRAWNLRLDENGILHWDNAVEGPHKIQLWDNGRAAGGNMNATGDSWDLQSYMRDAKKVTGTYSIQFNPESVERKSESVYFYYISPLAQLSAPANLSWNGQAGTWDAVPNATQYRIYLRHGDGILQDTYYTNNTSYDFGTNARDGYVFEVVATADNYLDSSAVTSPKYGSSTNPTAVSTANCTITVPVAGVAPDFAPVPTDSDKYSVTVDYWYPSDGSQHLTANDTFEAGKEYRVRVEFTAKAGYTFDENTVFTVNGETTSAAGLGGYREAVFNVPAAPTAIATANCTITAPAAGATPDFAPVPTDSDKYSVTVDYWYPSDGSQHLTANDTFEAGKEYRVRVEFTAKEGYTFDENTVFTVNGETTSAAGLGGYREAVFNVPATPQPTTYTVSFNMNGHGDQIAAQTVNEGAKATKPADPTASGWTFNGWYADATFSAAFDFNTAINAHTTIYAKWTKNTTPPATTYTVSFNMNGHGNQVAAQTVNEGAKATKPTDPTKDGYDFKGWTLNGSAYDFNTAVNGNITLVATWEQHQVVPTTYTVSFAANGGTGTMADVTGISGEYTLPENGFTAPDGKQFKAWSVDGNEKAVGDKITVTADTTITAVWETIPAGHTCDIKPVAKVEPSCTEGGKEAYYKCEGCGKFYEDALGTKEITDLASWGNLAKLGHTESDWKSDKDNHWKECTVAGCGVIIENSKAAHADANNDGKCDTCEYNVGKTPTNPGNKPSDDVQSPQTGDNSMMWLWIALLFVSGFGVVTTTVYGKKRKSVK